MPKPIQVLLISGMLSLPAVLVPPPPAPPDQAHALPSPFAYIREDGSEIPVPAAGSAEIPDIDEAEPVDVEEKAVSGFDPAVYTWSSVVS